MKSLVISAATAVVLLAAPAFAAGSNSISGSPAANSAGADVNANQTNPPCTSNNALGCGGMGGVDRNSGSTGSSSMGDGTSGSSLNNGSMTGSGSSSSTRGTGGNSLGNSGSMGTGSDGPIGTQQPGSTAR